MFGNLFRLRWPRLQAQNENNGAQEPQGPDVAKMRAVATGAALATSIDATPAVVVGIYDYAHRYRDRGRRSA